jgi:hypothetical protein
MKCANEHITADGRRINKGPNNHAMNQGHFNLGGRVMPSQGSQPTSSLLSMQQDHLSQPQPIPGQVDYMNVDMWKNPPYDIPTIDTTFSSHPGSNYGSPPNDGRLPISSPAQKGLSVLDAPLPASFDSQGISVLARYGPIAASVPSRFGLDSSPPSSSPNRPIESSALRNLHSSAFGDDHRNGKGSSLASSPPNGMDETMGRRIMHSERFSRQQPKMLSASVGARPPLAISDEWDENFAFEEDLVPNSLHELLTPQEKMRRFSRNAEDESILSHRQSLSGLGTPAESSSKVGSPSTASPSRFSGFFSSRQQPKDISEPMSLPGASAFGHVGSPLRNSSLHPGASPSIRAASRPTSGDVSPFVSSPPNRTGGIGMISQQLQRTRLTTRPSDDASPTLSTLQHPGVTRVASGSSVGPTPAGRLDRTVSSNSVGRDKIDEEPELFSMDDELGDDRRTSKRSSGGAWAHGSPFAPIGKASPKLGPIGGQRSSGSASKENAWANGA